MLRAEIGLEIILDLTPDAGYIFLAVAKKIGSCRLIERVDAHLTDRSDPKIWVLFAVVLPDILVSVHTAAFFSFRVKRFTRKRLKARTTSTRTIEGKIVA